MAARRWRGWALAAALAACETTPTKTPTGGGGEVTAAVAVGDPALLAIADAVDERSARPLATQLPEWAKTRIGAPIGAEEAVQGLERALRRWDEDPLYGPRERTRVLIDLVYHAVHAELRLAAGAEGAALRLALARVYAILEALATEPGIRAEVLQYIGRMIARDPWIKDVTPAQVQVDLRVLLVEAGPLHAHMAAEVLRRYGDGPEVPGLLERLADHAVRLDRHAQAIELRQKAMAMRGDQGTAEQQLALAIACFRGLQPECGEAALQAAARGASKQGPAAQEFARRIEVVTAMGKWSRRAAELEADPKLKDPKEDLGVALELGHLLLLLERGDALTLFERLKREHPQDARPYAGIAKFTAQCSGCFGDTSAAVTAAMALPNRDKDLYEPAIAAWGAVLLLDQLPQVQRGVDAGLARVVTGLLTDLGRFAEGYRAFDPARAGVVQAMAGVVQAAIPRVQANDRGAGKKAVRELLTRATALEKEFAGSPDVQRLRLMAAYLMEDRATALATVRRPLPAALAQDGPLARARVQAWLELTLRWDAYEELGKLQTAATALPVVEGDAVRPAVMGMLAALDYRRTGERATAEAAAKHFEAAAAAEGGTRAARAAALNNAGVMRAAMGEQVTAFERYGAASMLESEAMAIDLNRAALVVRRDGRLGAGSEVFMDVVRGAEVTALQLHAHAWRVVHCKGAPEDCDPAAALRTFGTALATLSKVAPPGVTPWTRRAAFAHERWRLATEYSLAQGLTIVNESGSQVWLVDPAPKFEELVAAAERAARQKPK